MGNGMWGNLPICLNHSLISLSSQNLDFMDDIDSCLTGCEWCDEKAPSCMLSSLSLERGVVMGENGYCDAVCSGDVSVPKSSECDACLGDEIPLSVRCC